MLLLDTKEGLKNPWLNVQTEDGEEIGFWENDIDWLYGTSEATRTADSEAVLDTQDAHPAAHETVEQVVEDVHGDAHENEDPDTSRMGATNCSESAQATRNQSFSSNPEFGLPGSNLNTSGSSGQSDRTRFPRKPVAKYLRSPVTRFPGRAVVKYPERKVARFQRKTVVKFLKRFATRFPRNRVAKFPGNPVSDPSEQCQSDPEVEPPEDSYLKMARIRSRKPGKRAMVPRKRATNFARKKGTLWKFRVDGYGLSEAGKEWYETLSAWFISIGVIRSETDPAFFFYYGKNGRLVGMLALHVDDALYAGSSRFNQVINYNESSVGEDKPEEAQYEGKKYYKSSVVQDKADKYEVKNYIDSSVVEDKPSMRKDKRYISVFTDASVGKLPDGNSSVMGILIFLLSWRSSKNQLTTNPKNTVFDAKRKIGCNWSDKLFAPKNHQKMDFFIFFGAGNFPPSNFSTIQRPLS